MFTCRYCKSRLNAYIQGGLEIKTRRWVARHLDSCPVCYARYLQQREVFEELSRRIPLIGHPQPAQLQRIWAAVQTEISPTYQSAWRQHSRYGLVTLVLVLVMLVPLTLGNQNVDFSIPLPPAPTLEVTDTPGRVDETLAVMLVITDSRNLIPDAAALRNTPEPGQ